MVVISIAQVHRPLFYWGHVVLSSSPPPRRRQRGQTDNSLKQLLLATLFNLRYHPLWGRSPVLIYIKTEGPSVISGDIPSCDLSRYNADRHIIHVGDSATGNCGCLKGEFLALRTGRYRPIATWPLASGASKLRYKSSAAVYNSCRSFLTF